MYIFIVNEKLRSVVGLQDLKDYMRQAGEVTYADAHKQHRNEGYVFIYVHNIFLKLLCEDLSPKILLRVFKYYRKLEIWTNKSIKDRIVFFNIPF